MLTRLKSSIGRKMYLFIGVTVFFVAMAMALWDACQGDPYTYSLRHTSHVQRLIGFGAEADILFAFKCNTCPVVPQLNNGVLTCK